MMYKSNRNMKYNCFTYEDTLKLVQCFTKVGYFGGWLYLLGTKCGLPIVLSDYLGIGS